VNFNGQVCIVTSNYYPLSIGGEETFIGQYSRFLKNKRIPFTVVSASSAPSGSGFEPVYFRPFSVPIFHFEAYSILWTFLATLKIVKIHSIQRIGVVHSIDTGHAGLASVFASRLLRVPLIVHSHGRRSDAWRDILSSTGDWRTWPYWALQRSIDKFVVGRSAYAIAVSSEVVSFLMSLGLPRSRILMVPSAVEIERYQSQDRILLRKKLGVQSDLFTIGYLGRLARLKGLEVLLEAYAKFSKESLRNTLVLIAGDGPIREILETMARERRLEGVKFLGFQRDVAGFLNSLDVFVLPSYAEGSPMALIEAMATGCPIIASDIEGVRELAGDSIILFPAGDYERLAESLQRVASDPDLRKRISTSAKMASHGFSTTSIFPRILALYRSSQNATSHPSRGRSNE
jgi:glycosyltransferase involved in cell wall biosynthesis